MLRKTLLKRSSKPLKRSPIKKSRTKPRPGRLEGNDLAQLRADCYRRDHGICQKCGRMTDWEADQESDNSFHMAHRRGKRMWGDHINQVEVECGGCHRKFHNLGAVDAKAVSI